VKSGNGHQRVTASGAIQVYNGGPPYGGGLNWVAITCPERSSGTIGTVRMFFIPGGRLPGGRSPEGGPAGRPGRKTTGTGPLAGMKNTAAPSAASSAPAGISQHSPNGGHGCRGGRKLEPPALRTLTKPRVPAGGSQPAPARVMSGILRKWGATQI
jgi:hypothetical protein